MKTIQKLTLGLLTVVATSSAFASGTVTLDVSSGSATASGLVDATLAVKTGAGTLVLSNAANAIEVLEIQQGQVDIAATGNFGGTAKFSTNAANKLNMVAAAVAVPSIEMAIAGILDCNGNATSLAAAPTGTALLSIDGAGVLTIAANMTASSTPMHINANANVAVGASGTSILPTAAVGVGGILNIKGATASCVPGDTTVASAGILQVDGGLTVPASGAGDLFGTLLFQSGAVLKLGASSVWARAISVGTAL